FLFLDLFTKFWKYSIKTFMKIVIIADIHDNLPNLKKCLDWCRANNVEKIICCGDVANNGTLRFLSENFSQEIYLVRGNMELYESEEPDHFKNINFLGRTGRIKIDGFNIGICHEPLFFDQILKDGRCDIIFYGHTHRPWIKKEKIKELFVQTVNPGTLGAVFQSATFAIWDSTEGGLKLKSVDNI
ncbi:MAG: YfcE family phosphodiesterase, partial [bacterium]